jgi:hypothetical protein
MRTAAAGRAVALPPPTKKDHKNHGKETPSSGSVQDHVYWKQDPSFRIIPGLENARSPAASLPSDCGDPGRGQLCLVRVQNNPEVPHFKRFLIHLSGPTPPFA